MIHDSSDFRSNANEQKAHCAEILSHEGAKRILFKAIYFGKKAVKTIEELSVLRGLNYKRVLTEGKQLADLQVVRQIKHGGRVIGFSPIQHLKASKAEIFRLAESANKRAHYPTKRSPQARGTIVSVKFPRQRNVSIDARFISVDDIEEFSRVRQIKHKEQNGTFCRLPERVFKYGLAEILGNVGTFQDWGGENNDLYSTHITIRGHRLAAAFALKGPAKAGVLTPAKMGKNADQITRLLRSPAQVFIIQYEGEVAESVYEQLKRLAIATSASEQNPVYYGVIAAEDSLRLRIAYSEYFESAAEQVEARAGRS